MYDFRNPYTITKLLEISALLARAAEHEIEETEPGNRNWQLLGVLGSVAVEPVEDLWQPWAGLVQDAAAHYLIVRAEKEPTTDSNKAEVRDELQGFSKRLGKARKALGEDLVGLHSLSEDARGMLALGGLRAGANIDALASQLQTCGTALDQLVQSANAGARMLRGTRSEDVLLFQFVEDLASIYEQATGREIGRGHHFNDKTYQGPFEAFLMVCLTPVRTETTIESVRGLIRRVQKAQSIGSHREK